MIDETHFSYDDVVVVVAVPSSSSYIFLGVKLNGGWWCCCCWWYWLLLFPSRVLVVLCMPSVFCHGCVQHKKVVKCSSSLLSLSSPLSLSLSLSSPVFFFKFLNFYLSPFFSFSNFVWLVCRRSYLSLLGFLSLNPLSLSFKARDLYSPFKKLFNFKCYKNKKNGVHASTTFIIFIN